jgi:tRNA threonylcarbamoyl adenosine modification protein YeaZ
MNTVLVINTSEIGKVMVGIITSEKEFKVEKEQKFGSQALLGAIQEVLEKANLELKDLTGIKVNIGPGSFTGLRVGVSVANALAYSLKIPVNEKKIETELVY